MREQPTPKNQYVHSPPCPLSTLFQLFPPHTSSHTHQPFNKIHALTAHKKKPTLQHEIETPPQKQQQQQPTVPKQITTTQTNNNNHHGDYFSNTFFTIRPSTLGGLGAFATASLSTGQVILEEKPLCVAAPGDVITAFRALAKDEQARALELFASPHHKRGTLREVAVWNTNWYVSVFKFFFLRLWMLKS